MTFRFSCPHCHALTDVEDQYAGQSGACFSCGQPIHLPQLESIIATEADKIPQTVEGEIAGEAIADQHSRVEAASDEVSKDVGQADKTKQLLEQESNRSWRACLTTLIATPVIFLIGGLIWLLVATFGPSIGLLGDEGASRSKRNLERIAGAMFAYHEDHGSFPPAYLPDANGKPIHSWRVLLLPYLGEDALYQSYNFNEPWDGPGNSILDSQMPKVYRSQLGTSTSANYETNYMVITGFETVFPGSTTVSKDQILDGPADTILVAEIENNGVSWMEPIDLDASKMSFAVNASAGREIGSNRSSGALIVTADGKVHRLQNNTSPALIESLVTIDGAEPVQANELDNR